tara:strand:- start:826 stop:1359 length:534 start_codon:yes stop_codon:yes gene_type:complete
MPTDLVVVRNFITASEQTELKRIALYYLEQGILEANPRGPDRYRAKIWNTPYCTDFIKQIGERVISRFELMGCPVDLQLGWIISLLQPGAQIHPHIDKYPYHQTMKAKHLRCNIMVSKDNDSGNPVIAGQSIDVTECALWGFFPSEAVHSTDIINTSSPRIAYQFGFVVPQNYQFLA